MKALDEYNEEKFKVSRKITCDQPNGLTCPKCEHEMMDAFAMFRLAPSYPPRMRVYCPSCKHEDYKAL